MFVARRAAGRCGGHASVSCWGESLVGEAVLIQYCYIKTVESKFPQNKKALQGAGCQPPQALCRAGKAFPKVSEFRKMTTFIIPRY